MTEDAKSLNKLLKDRKDLVKSNEEKVAAENKKRLMELSKIRDTAKKMRMAKDDAKERERKKKSRTFMHNLETSADYPEAPQYVPHMINVLKNILGKYSLSVIC